MSKKLNPDKLTLGIRKDVRKEKPPANDDMDKLVKKIHAAVPSGTEEATKRTTLDIPKDLHKKISMRALIKDLTLKDYFLELAKSDLSNE
jgi:uncharacterized protein YdeI (YjbR/CyaY-like superfamily)